MSPKVLYKSGCLGAGANLWILPDFDQTEWVKSIDWYLNFQLSKAHAFQPQPLPKELEKLAEKFPLRKHSFQSPPPLLVASSEFFPNQAVIKISLKDEKQWLHEVYKIWKQMKQPTLRLFLPRKLTKSNFESLWPEPIDMEHIAVVPGI